MEIGESLLAKSQEQHFPKVINKRFGSGYHIASVSVAAVRLLQLGQYLW